MSKLLTKLQNLALGKMSATARWEFITKSNTLSQKTVSQHRRFRRNHKEAVAGELRSTTVSLPSLPVFIAENAALALANHNRIAKKSIPPLAIYTDGSKINNRLGAAAIAHSKGTYSQAYLGAKSSPTINAAELMGIWMAIDIAIRTKATEAVIFSDSQAALRTIREIRIKPECYGSTFAKTLREIHRTGVSFQLHWIPAHKGIIGNQTADKLAKEAARFQRASSTNPANCGA